MNDQSPDVYADGTYRINAQAIILAGGLGTRLRSVVPDLPKCMAPVAGRPFLFYVINYLRSQGITNFIFSLGYKHEVIEEYLQAEFSRLTYTCVIEEEPLGTGGAIRFACEQATFNNVIVTNGDTLFKVNLPSLLKLHIEKQASCTLALKPLGYFDRYGVVEINDKQVVESFKEKQHYDNGLINGGVYVIDRQKFLQQTKAGQFSFEKDYLEKTIKENHFIGDVQDEYFIDIGIPEDLEKAQQDLQKPPLDLKAIDSSWTLLLDRDGVLNEDKEGSYIFTPDEFVFMGGPPTYFQKLSALFKYIIIVTNQRGVGRGLMTEAALTIINKKMEQGIRDAGGRLSAIYYATQNDNLDPDRKPNPGMAFRAKYDFPDIDLDKTIMVGNNLTDMQFGRNAGVYTVFLPTTNKSVKMPHPDIDFMFDTLEEFAKAL